MHMYILYMYTCMYMYMLHVLHIYYVMGKVEMKAYHLSLVLPGDGFVVRC